MSLGESLFQLGSRGIEWLSEHLGTLRSHDAFQRDPNRVVELLPTLERMTRWFRPEIRGLDKLPLDGPFLVAGNHSGGLYTPEAYVLFVTIARHFAAHRPVYLLAHDLLFAIPWFGRNFRQVGGIPANHENAARALEEGAVVIVFPGGDHEAFRPFWDRHKIDFGERRGFVRLALSKGVPIVPAVSYGSHETTFVVARGDSIARALRLNRVRVKIFPWVLGLPWGLVPGFIPVFPWPAKITIQFCSPIAPVETPVPEDEMPAVVDGTYRTILDVMQSTLNTLVKNEPYPLFAS